MKLLWKILLFLAVIGFTACDKEDDDTTPDTDDINTEIQSVSDQEYVLSEMNSIYGMTNEVFSMNAGGRVEMSFCAAISIDSINRQIIFDFGQEGCISDDGRKRTGRILISYIGKIRDQDNRRTVQFENYTVDGTSINGELSTSSFTRNSQGQYHFDRMVDLAIVKSDASNFSIKATHDFVMLEGEGSEDIFAVVFQITGSASGVKTDGESFSGEITSPLLLKMACLQDKIPYPVSGVTEIMEGRTKTIVDFGEGTCDKVITVTVGRTTKEVELP